MADRYGDNPVHPIVDKPWQFDIVRFDLHHDPDDHRADYLDLWLRRGSETRRLRFAQPSSIKIEEGFPQPTVGRDVRAGFRGGAAANAGERQRRLESVPGREG
jgi:hypothetical protein